MRSRISGSVFVRRFVRQFIMLLFLPSSVVGLINLLVASKVRAFMKSKMRLGVAKICRRLPLAHKARGLLFVQLLAHIRLLVRIWKLLCQKF